MKSYHTLDIPFAFYNIDQAASMTGAMQERYALAHRMSAAFAAFARTGNPNHADLPNVAGVQHARLSDDDVRQRVQGASTIRTVKSGWRSRRFASSEARRRRHR